MRRESFRSRGNGGTRSTQRKPTEFRYVFASIDKRWCVYVIGGVFAQSAVVAPRRRFSRLTTRRDNAASRAVLLGINRRFSLLPFTLFTYILLHIFTCIPWLCAGTVLPRSVVFAFIDQ